MRKNVFKVVAACAAVCFVSGLVLFNGGSSTKAADDYVFNYNFDDGVVPDGITSSAKLELIEGMNSNVDALAENPNAPADTNGNCVKVTNRTGYWEISGLSCSVKDFVEGDKYKISFDIYHDNAETEKYNDNRAVVIKGMENYLHIEGPYASPKGYWERMTITYEHKQREIWDSAANAMVPAPLPHTLHLEFAYPEPYEDQGDTFKDPNKEEYYIDNFSIVKIPDATPTPEPTPTPTVAPTATPTEEPTLPPIVEGPSLEVGYEEAVKDITYKVTGLDTVTVVGFDVAKSKLTIPATITLEGYAYKVTAIANNAFKGESIKTLTIGSNVTSIGKNAFANCKSLKKITVKSTVIKSMGKNAFKKTNAKATVKVPKSKKAAYKKLFKKAGLSKKAKIK